MWRRWKRHWQKNLAGLAAGAALLAAAHRAWTEHERNSDNHIAVIAGAAVRDSLADHVRRYHGGVFR